jgi:hypothetical protein
LYPKLSDQRFSVGWLVFDVDIALEWPDERVRGQLPGAGGYLGGHFIQLRAIFENVDFDDPLVAKRMELSGGSGWDRQLERTIVLCTTPLDGESSFASPMATLMQPGEPVNLQEFLERNRLLSAFSRFEAEEYKGQRNYVGTFRDKYGAGEFGKFWFFPKKKSSLRDRVKSMRT